MNPFNDYNAGQTYGYQATSTYLNNSSNQTNQVPVSNLSDPFGSVNPVVLPYGSNLGVNTQLGSSAIYFAQLHVPYNEKGSFDIQKQFGHTWLVEGTAYVSHSVHLSSSLAVSSTPLLPLLSRSQKLDTATTTLLNAPIANPFKNLFPAATTANGITVPNTNSSNTSSTISNAQLLQGTPSTPASRSNWCPTRTRTSMRCC